MPAPTTTMSARASSLSGAGRSSSAVCIQRDLLRSPLTFIAALPVMVAAAEHRLRAGCSARPRRRSPEDGPAPRGVAVLADARLRLGAGDLVMPRRLVEAGQEGARSRLDIGAVGIRPGETLDRLERVPQRHGKEFDRA